MTKTTHKQAGDGTAGRYPDASVREFFRTRNPIINAIVTGFSGKALIGQKPLYELDGFVMFNANIAAYLAAQILLVIILMWMGTAGLLGIVGAPLAAVFLVLVIGRLRTFQVAYSHYAVHGLVSKHWPGVNRVVRVFSTVICFSQNAEEYFRDHILRHHKLRSFSTWSDPDARFLYELGFRRGMGKREVARHLVLTCLSPNFHITFLKARFMSAFVTSSTVHRTAAILWLAVLVSAAFFLPLWVWATAILLPFTLGLQMSSLLQFATEHRLGVPGDPVEDSVEYMKRCNGRYALLPPPLGMQGVATVTAWAKWSLAMIPELLIRYGVLVGDLPNHDFHHGIGFANAATRGQPNAVKRDPLNWVIAPYDRQAHIDEDGDPMGMAERDHYGYAAALYWAFSAVDD